MRTDIAGPAGAMASNDHSVAPTAAAQRPGGEGRQAAHAVRNLLIGLEAFNALRGVQGSAPTPRLDLRYLVEGSIELLGSDHTLFQRWLHASRVALARQLSQDGKAGEGAERSEGTGAGVSARTEGIGAALSARTEGTGAGLSARAEGCATDAITQVTALTQTEWNLRNVGNDRAPGRPRPRNAPRPDCRSLLIGELAFQRLKLVQGTTRDPRLEMRSLVEGAVALLGQETDLHAAWVTQSRQALAEHLEQLRQQPLHTCQLEIKT